MGSPLSFVNFTKNPLLIWLNFQFLIGRSPIDIQIVAEVHVVIFRYKTKTESKIYYSGLSLVPNVQS